MADDAAFSSAPFLRIGELRFAVRFWLLLWRDLHVKRVIMTKPAVTVIRDTSGKFDLDSLGARQEEPPASAEEKEVAEGSAAARTTSTSALFR